MWGFALVVTFCVGVFVACAQYSARSWVRTLVIIALLGMIGGSSFVFTEVAMRANREQAERDRNLSDAHLEGRAAMMRDAQIARVPIFAAAAALALLAFVKRR